MQPRSRRHLLRMGCAGAVIGLAGCLETLQLGGTNPGRNNTAAGLEAAVSMHHAAPLQRPAWHVADEDAVGAAHLIDSQTAMADLIDQYDLTMEDLDPASVDFDEQVGLFLQSVGPDVCYTLEVEHLDIEDGTVVGSASAIKTVEDQACAAAVNYPLAIVLLETDETPVTAASIELTDGWDNTATVTDTPAP